LSKNWLKINRIEGIWHLFYVALVLCKNWIQMANFWVIVEKWKKLPMQKLQNTIITPEDSLATVKNTTATIQNTEITPKDTNCIVQA
jgi:hypothetical protein